MGYETENIFNAGQRMDFFGDANAGLFAASPLAVELFGELKTVVGLLADAGAARSSAGSAGKSETRTKAAIYNSLYADLRAIAGTAAMIKKREPNFENKFLLANDKLTYQEAIERGRAFHEDSAPPVVGKLFTKYGLESDFRADLIGDVNALAASTQTQQDAKRSSVGDTAQIETQIENLMDIRETSMRVMKNILKNNPQKLAEWMSASRIERAAKQRTAPKISSNENT